MIQHNLSTSELALLTKVARLYYEQKIRQPEIAKQLNISQSRVSRLLTQAVEIGVVRITIVSPNSVHPELEDELREMLGLQDVIVAHVDDDTEESALSAIGSAGAGYLEATLNETDRIGLSSWSSTLLAVVDAMAPGLARAKEIIQIQGGVGNPTAQVQATRLTERFAAVTGGEVKYLAAPGVVANKAVRDGLFQDPYIGQVAEDWNQLTVALLGIGALQPSKLLKDSGNTLSEDDLKSLSQAKAVGDVCLHYFDQIGNSVESTLDDRVIAISAKQLQAIPRRIGMAGGKRKVEAILAASKGKWIDVLITDSATAKWLLSEQ